jgi:hypothetical protein
MRSSLQFAQQVDELHVVKLLVESLILIVREFQTLHILHRNWQIIVVPRVVYASEYLIWHSNLSEDHEQPLRPLEDPFHVSVICQTLPECKRPVKKSTLFSTQL